MKTTWWYMVLFAIVRHILGFVGTWLIARGVIDADTHMRLLSEGASDIVGWSIIAAVIAWSIVQKTQAWQRILAALHINPKAGVTDDVMKEVARKAEAPNATL